MRRTKDGIPVIKLHYSALPYATPEWIEEQRKRYTSQAYWDLEMECKYEALSGTLIYGEFDPSVHVVYDKEVPKSGCRYMAIDPHPRTPHAFLWVLIDRFSDWWIYRDLWPSVVYGDPRNVRDNEEDNQFTIREYCETLAALEGNSLEWHNAEEDSEYAIYRRKPSGERIIDRFMDQAGKGFRASGDGQQEESYSRRYDRFGLQCADPFKGHRSGEDAIHSLLKLRRHETRGLWPRLHVAESAKEMILELQKLRFRVTKRSDERELKQDAVELRSHCADLLRYLACSQISFIPTLVS